MTCMQEILYRLSSAVRFLAVGDKKSALDEVEHVVRHVESHGGSEFLESCKFEEGEKRSLKGVS